MRRIEAKNQDKIEVGADSKLDMTESSPFLVYEMDGGVRSMAVSEDEEYVAIGM